MNQQVPKEKLGTSKIYQYDPTSKFQALAIGSGFAFMQSKLKNL